jgi:hypothetical protein
MRTDGQTARSTDMVKLLRAFRNFANALKNDDKFIAFEKAL